MDTDLGFCESGDDLEDEYKLIAVEIENEQCQSVLLLFSIPEEIYLQILSLLHPLDILSLGKTCKFFSSIINSELIWKNQWLSLTNGLDAFSLPPIEDLTQLGVLFKDCCKRLWSVVGDSGRSYPPCSHCHLQQCHADCLMEPTRLVVDIGGKLTWIIDSNYGLKKHMSMIAVPKLLRCNDCDSIIDRARTQAHCDCHSEGGLNCSDSFPFYRAQSELYCKNSSVSSHTALEYCSQPLDRLSFQGVPDRPLCLFCEEYKINRLLCEKEMVHSNKMKLSGYFHSKGSQSQSSGEDSYKSSNLLPPFTNGYCQDTASLYGVENLDILSPLLALEHRDAFPVVRAYLDHILKHFKMIGELQRPNFCLVVTEPSYLPLACKELLLKFFFEEVELSRLCLLPKALAIALLFEQSTCVVIDSGATSTSVWVVIEGAVDTARTQTIPVGGWHVSNYLKQSLAWKDLKESAALSVSSLDLSSVKAKCRLPLSLARETQQEYRGIPPAGGGGRCETLAVKTERSGGRYGVARAEQQQQVTEVSVSRGSLYLAPEMMYSSLELPARLTQALRDLPNHTLKDCLTHILVQGGNTDLQGFSTRLSCDLREAMPEHSAIINVCSFPTGNHSYNTAMGANMAKVPPKFDDVLQLHKPGTPFWISREEYVLFGSHRLTELGDVDEM